MLGIPRGIVGMDSLLNKHVENISFRQSVTSAAEKLAATRPTHCMVADAEHEGDALGHEMTNQPIRKVNFRTSQTQNKTGLKWKNLAASLFRTAQLQSLLRTILGQGIW